MASCGLFMEDSMKLVRQRNKVDCGLAVAAMIAETSWTKAAKADKNPDSKHGLTVREFMAICESLGSPLIVSAAGRNKPFQDATRPHNACAAIIRQAGKHRGHFIAIDSDQVLDPDLGRFALTHYSRGNWMLVRWFVRD
jgi:hypothetical protein